MMQWIIERKRDGIALSDDEIQFFVEGYASGTIPDYQAAAFAMAVFFKGMTKEETVALTRAMWRSGITVNTSSVVGPKIDKHSTGGIGDNVSLVLAPLAAACGLVVPMIAGRGLGITGGTLDKLESIPGYTVDFSERDFIRVLKACGCSIIGQTPEIAPADRKLYALRDVTGTVPSLPLIVSSILGKKLSAGLDGLVLDVKCGSGAFMKNAQQAGELARTLIEVASILGLRASALITDMSRPLGRNVGNALELAEAVETMKGGGPSDLVELTLALCARMLVMAGAAKSVEGAEKKAMARLRSGAAFERFREMVRQHHGDITAIEHPDQLCRSRIRKEVRAPERACVRSLNAEAIGKACLILGAGRARMEEKIDPSVGVAGLRKPGEWVEKGEVIAAIHASGRERAAEALPLVEGAFEWSDRSVEPTPLILDELWSR